MTKTVLFLFQAVFIFTLSEAKSHSLQPQAAGSFNISYIQTATGCSYVVDIATSCSSTKFTRDQISIAFGDAYGNQVYAPRLDDPSTRAFERCSSDTFEIYGPCAYQICYVYLYRSGPDGWMPETVSIAGYNAGIVTFSYNTFIPSETWYGFNSCRSSSSSHQRSSWKWLMFLMLGLALNALI